LHYNAGRRQDVSHHGGQQRFRPRFRASRKAVVADAESTVGPIDVLVANAGYGHEGTFEESSMEQLRDQFAVNGVKVTAIEPGAFRTNCSDALSAVTTALRQFADEADQYRELTMSTDFGAGV
jgi:NAD(P)-dependent dehydrogenase (short-subunit alcohol dehydrogenase family)